jgi:hypothetical protein
MSAPVFASFVDLQFNPIQVNIEDNITDLSPIPTLQLPPAVIAATKIQFADNAIVVQGTPVQTAAIIAAAAGGSPLGLIFAVIKMSDGSILAQNAAAIAAGLVGANFGVGVCTVTINAPGYTPFTGAAPLVTPIDKGEAFLGGYTATVFGVQGFDNAGVAQDTNFNFYLFPTP